MKLAVLPLALAPALTSGFGVAAASEEQPKVEMGRLQMALRRLAQGAPGSWRTPIPPSWPDACASNSTRSQPPPA